MHQAARGKALAALAHGVEAGVQPFVDFMMEGQQAAGETGEEKEQRGSQTDIAVQQDQDGAHGGSR